MPARDIYHDVVKKALIKDGWTILADPLIIAYDDVQAFADLAAERTLAAEKAGRRIAVEIKTFQGASPVRDFEEALGQYMFYRGLLSLAGSDYLLYLAVSEETYHRVFERKALREITERSGLALLVVDLAQEVIVRWTTSPATAN
jgi:XisH protein